MCHSWRTQWSCSVTPWGLPRSVRPNSCVARYVTAPHIKHGERVLPTSWSLYSPGNKSECYTVNLVAASSHKPVLQEDAMSVLTTFDPFFRDFDRLTRRGQGPRFMPADAFRRGDEFVVNFDLPGV